MRTRNLVAFSFIQHQNKTTFKELLPGSNLHLVTDRGLPTGEIDASVDQYCLTHLLRIIQGLAEHPETTHTETDQLGEIYDSIQQLFIDKHRISKSA